MSFSIIKNMLPSVEGAMIDDHTLKKISLDFRLGYQILDKHTIW
jgi:hypothetical protein